LTVGYTNPSHFAQLFRRVPAFPERLPSASLTFASRWTLIRLNAKREERIQFCRKEHEREKLSPLRLERGDGQDEVSKFNATCRAENAMKTEDARRKVEPRTTRN